MVMEDPMSRKKLFLSCLLSLTAVPFTWAQAQPMPYTPPAAAPVESVNPLTAASPATGMLEPTQACNTLCETSCQNIWTRSKLTGDWCGLRPSLQEKGVTFGGNLTQYAFGVGGGVNTTRGPLSPGDTFKYTSFGSYNATFDLEKFGGLPKGKLFVQAQHWFGQYGNVTPNTGSFAPAIFGAALPPAPDYEGVPYITDFVITQPLSQHLVVYGGKKNVLGVVDQDKFAGGNGTSQFLNQAFCANPAFLLGLPYTSFTAGIASPQDWGIVSAFVLDPQDRTRDFFRLDDLFSKGVIVGAEIRKKSNYFGMPGDQHIGAIWKHRELTDLSFAEPPPGVYPEPVVPGFPTLNDSYTIYGGFDQYLQVLSQETKRGWGLFGRASISDGNPTPVQYFLSAGIGGYSPIAHQRGDTFGAAVYFVGASKEFGPLPQAIFGPRDGYGVELFYNFQITPWMNLTPDFQIVKPEAGAIANMAYIGGIRLKMDW
jgi:porin